MSCIFIQNLYLFKNINKILIYGIFDGDGNGNMMVDHGIDVCYSMRKLRI